MTQIDFYLLSKDPTLAFVCRLADKIYRLEHTVFVHTATADQAIELDDVLWTFEAGSFVPHALVKANQADTDVPPVLIGEQDDPRRNVDVMINLAPEVPPFFSRFERVAEVVAADEALRAAARERFRFYRERGYTLKTHNL